MRMSLLVKGLPEQYQPIYGYSEFDDFASRFCQDRMNLLLEIVTQLIKKYNRPLKIADLGCAQGFFCFKLAELGCEVVGVDFSDKNIAVCDALAKEHSNLHCSFEFGDVIEKIDEMKSGDFDLVYGLSVFHHICHERGAEFVKEKLKELSKKCDVFLYEAALKEEPLYWADRLPEKAYELIQDFSFYRQVAFFPTHLSHANRPFYFCSNKIWYLDDSIEFFDRYTHFAHEQSDTQHRDTRRFYFAKHYFLKCYYFRGVYAEEQKTQMKNEVDLYTSDFLKNVSNFIPRYIGSITDDESAYVVLEKIEGVLLSSLLFENKSFLSKTSIIHEILQFLTLLEAEGNYYSDLRCWNIMIEKDKVKIIDLASIVKQPKDLGFPSNVFASFMVFVYELFNLPFIREDALRQLKTSPVWFTGEIQDWMEKIWSISSAEWSFDLFLKLFLDKSKLREKIIHLSNISFWMGMVEEFCYRVTGFSELNAWIHDKDVQIERLINQKKCIESDSLKRYNQIEMLKKILDDSEIERVESLARDIQIKELTKLLKESESDRAERLKIIEATSQQVNVLMQENLAQEGQIKELIKLLKESESDRAERLKIIEGATHQINCLHAEIEEKNSVIRVLITKEIM